MPRMLSHASTGVVASSVGIVASRAPFRARRARATAAFALLLAVVLAHAGCSAGCSQGPDPRTIEGATAYATVAIQEGDTRRLFRVVDARARHAMSSIVADRRRQAALIEASYPPDERAAALAALGDAKDARDAADLFARRCDARCLGALRATLGAPVTTRTEGEVTVVRTTRDADVAWYRKGASDWWGLVWNTDALVRERDRANRDLGAITENAATYDRRRQLESP